MRLQVEARRVLVNALTVDVEDYFQVWALSPYLPRSKWEETPARVERNVDLILQLLDEARAHATFFTLGWVAERFPQLVRRIAAAGHEIASHGYAHVKATELSPERFFADILLAKTILQDIADVEVSGYRAPSFSIVRENEFRAYQCIAEAGYRYSSSVYPIRHDHYGIPDAPRFPHWGGDVLEVPIATARFLGRNWPAGGGGYFRLLPYPVSRWLIQRVNEVDGRPAVFYFHPWELDPGQPRVPDIDAKTRFRHYVNLHRTEHRLRRLLHDFRWDRVDHLFLEGAETSPVSSPAAPGAGRLGRAHGSAPRPLTPHPSLPGGQKP
jgi:polysaccharide deacetylase family protein (PEP-CTERM system associated)